MFPEWPHDSHPIGSPFGKVLSDVAASYTAPATAEVKFQGANPRNDYHTMGTFMTVERMNSTSQWEVVLTDSDWDTVFHWERQGIERHSVITLTWQIPAKTPSGKYRMRYFGDAKNTDGSITPFTGTSSVFTVSSSQTMSKIPVALSSLQSIFEWWKTTDNTKSLLF